MFISTGPTLSLRILGNFSCFFDVWLFFKINFFKKSIKKTSRVSIGLNPDQNRQKVSPELGSNCLQRLLADGKGRC